MDEDGVGDESDDTAEEAAGLSALELTGVVLSASFDGVELAGSSGAEVGAGEGVGESVVTGPAGLGVGAGVAGARVAVAQKATTKLVTVGATSAPQF